MKYKGSSKIIPTKCWRDPYEMFGFLGWEHKYAGLIFWKEYAGCIFGRIKVGVFCGGANMEKEPFWGTLCDQRPNLYARSSLRGAGRGVSAPYADPEPRGKLGAGKGAARVTEQGGQPRGRRPNSLCWGWAHLMAGKEGEQVRPGGGPIPYGRYPMGAGGEFEREPQQGGALPNYQQSTYVG